MTPLHWAAHGGHEAAATLLLQRGASVAAANGEGWTPLHYAACAGHGAVVALLLRSGADPDTPNAAGRSPLAMAKDTATEALLRGDGAAAGGADFDYGSQQPWLGAAA